jgi:hypothetical protein
MRHFDKKRPISLLSAPHDVRSISLPLNFPAVLQAGDPYCTAPSLAQNDRFQSSVAEVAHLPVLPRTCPKGLSKSVLETSVRKCWYRNLALERWGAG